VKRREKEGSARSLREWEKQQNQERTSLPGAEVPPHQQIVERRHANQLQNLRHDLLRHALLHMIALQRLPHLVEDVEDIVHAERRSGTALDESIEQSRSSLRRLEPRKGLRLDDCWDDHLGEFLLGFGDPGVVDVVLQRIEIVLDDSDELLVVGPFELASCSVIFPRVDSFVDVVFGYADEGEEFVDVGEPEDSGDDGVVEFEALRGGGGGGRRDATRREKKSQRPSSGRKRRNDTKRDARDK